MAILFYVEGRKRKGTGHVYNSLRIAKELRERELEAHFLIRAEKDSPLLDKVKEAGFKAGAVSESEEELKRIKETIANDSSQLLFLDFYPLRGGIINNLKGEIKIGTTAFFGQTESRANFLLNYFVGLKGVKSEREGFFFGPEYFAFTRDFKGYYNQFRRFCNDSKDRKKVLVFTGGRDVHRLNVSSLEALSGMEIPLDITVLKGSSTSYFDEVLFGALNNEQSPMKGKHVLEIRENAQNFYEIIQNSDLAIASAGNVAYELVALGLPTIFVCQAWHQTRTASVFEKLGAGINLGYFSREFPPRKIKRAVEEILGTPRRLEEMSEAGREIFKELKYGLALDYLEKLARD